MSDVIKFLSARLSEDEVAAHAAADKQGGSVWAITDIPYEGICVWAELDVPGETSEVTDHLARHDPARVLREVASKRAILQAYGRAPSASSHISAFVRGQDAGYAEALADTLRHLASAYSDHPDYRQEWAL